MLPILIEPGLGSYLRHPELVSGPISPPRGRTGWRENCSVALSMFAAAPRARWVLKRVQHDGLLRGGSEMRQLSATLHAQPLLAQPAAARLARLVAQGCL